MQKLSFLLVVVLLFSNYSFGQENYKSTHSVSDATNTRFHTPVNTTYNRSKPSVKPKNIILLIGDGMGTAQIYAGYTANKGQLNIMSMPYSGFTAGAIMPQSWGAVSTFVYDPKNRTQDFFKLDDLFAKGIIVGGQVNVNTNFFCLPG